MHNCVTAITRCCIKNGTIDEDQAAWFQYGLEKRITTILVAIPFLIIAVCMTSITSAAFFFLSFFLLRTRTNGYHAKTFAGCITVSLIVEIILCICFYPLLTPVVSWVLCIACSFLIFKFAPYVHKNLPLTREAISVCQKSARRRICALDVVFVCFLYIGFDHAAKGIIMGITMASGMLCFPYIIRRMKQT